MFSTLKWHLGFLAKEYTPVYRGFASHFGYLTGKEDYWDHTNVPGETVSFCFCLILCWYRCKLVVAYLSMCLRLSVLLDSFLGHFTDCSYGWVFLG